MARDSFKRIKRPLMNPTLSQTKKAKRQQRTVEAATNNSNDDIVLYNSSSVADKEVFTSGEFYFDK